MNIFLVEKCLIKMSNYDSHKDQYINSTILSFEDDLGGSGFESLPQWRVFKFKQRNEEGNEREGSDGPHSPF